MPHLVFLCEPYRFFVLKSSIIALSSGNTAYSRLSLASSASRSLIRRSSEASKPPHFDFHL